MVRTTIAELLESARRGFQRLTPQEAMEAMRAGTCLIDIRDESQIARDGGISGAWLVARNVLEWRLDPDSTARDARAPGLDEPIIVICHEGCQSSLAASTLQRLGFARATDVIGGFTAWRAAGLPVARPEVGMRCLGSGRSD